MIDKDGTYAYSKIVAIKLNGTLNDDAFSVYPNPFVNNIKLMVNTSADGLARIRVISFDGKEMMNKTVGVQKGNNIIVLSEFGNMSSGSYILELTTSDGRYTRKIVKTNSLFVFLENKGCIFMQPFSIRQRSRRMLNRDGPILYGRA